MSFDVPKHRHTPIEIYGDKGSILVPDPNRFGGEVQVVKTGGEWEAVALTHGHVEGEFRSIGVADMATAILTGRAAPRQRRVGLPRARGDGGVPDLGRPRPARDDRKPRRTAGHDAGGTSKPDRSTEGDRKDGDNAQGDDRMGRLERDMIPDLCASMMRGWLKAEGFDVRIETSTAAFADPAIHDLSLIVPIYTMSKIEKPEALNLCAAVAVGRRACRTSWRHVRRLPRVGGLPVSLRRSVGRPSGQHHRLQGRRDANRTIR